MALRSLIEFGGVFISGAVPLTKQIVPTKNESGQVEASLEKARQMNVRNPLRAMHLGPVGQITKERLYEATFAIERKLAAASA